MKRLLCCAAVVAGMCQWIAPAAPRPRKILFVSGPKDHGRPNRHEYAKDMAVMKYCIDHMPEAKGVATEAISGQVPDASRLQDVAAVVMESSGDRIPKETHAMFPQDATTDHETYDAATMARLNAIDALLKKGMGLVSIHYSTWVNNAAGRKFYLDWLGGVAEYPDDTKVKVAAWSADPQLKTKHPILRGITPWSYEQEEFFTAEYLPEDARRTPLLVVSDAASGMTSTVSWAVERAGGGRGFEFTGMDFHKGWAIEQHRRMLLNGVLWAAHMEVPKGGASCQIPDDLM